MLCPECFTVLPDPTPEACPRCAAALWHVAGLGARQSRARRTDGLIAAKAPPRDTPVATPVAGSAPPSVDLRPYCSPVEDQQSLGSCASCAVVGALEFLQIKQGKPPVDRSRLFVYFNARKLRNAVGEDSGNTTAEVIASVVAFGVPPEQEWPYRIEDFNREPPRRVYDSAWTAQGHDFARVVGADGVIGALAQGLPVSLAINLPQRCYEEAARTGRFPDPRGDENLDPSTAESGHCMLIVGYDRNRGTFLIRNSWGAKWGQGGYAEMPIRLAEQQGFLADSWIVGHLDRNPSFHLAPPAAHGAAAATGPAIAEMRDRLRAEISRDVRDAVRRIKDNFQL